VWLLREVALGREVETWRQSQIRLDDLINRLRRQVHLSSIQFTLFYLNCIVFVYDLQKFSASNKQELLELLAAMELSVVVREIRFAVIYPS
jgi:hypothetical protein